MPSMWTRREVLSAGLKAGGGLIVLGAAGYVGYRWPHSTPAPASTSGQATSAPKSGTQVFISRPDLEPPQVSVTASPRLRQTRTPRQVILAPRGYATGAPGQQGLMIVDVQGQLQWFRATASTPMDARVQTYHGNPVITWWEGEVPGGYGMGTGQIINESYLQLATVKAGNGLQADLHEFLLTPQGTALVTAYNPVSTDLTSVGGPKSGEVLDCVAQEVDVATGHVLFEWHSIDHVPLTETYSPSPGASPTTPYDYFHINSIEVMPDGDLLISARNTWALYKVSRSTGAVVWRLNGRRSDFTMGSGSHFYWQHDARAVDASTISLFDDGASPTEESESRGIVISIDSTRMAVSLAHQYTHPAHLLAPNQGNMQVLQGGGAFVGWGAEPYFSQFAAGGELLLDGRLPNNVQSYRTYLQDWIGAPTTVPDLVVKSSAVVGATAYVSWNGATQVASWQILAGATPTALSPAATSRRTGFETTISVASKGPYYTAVALGSGGTELGRSTPVMAQG